ncbi:MULTISPECIES: hypothetical protein [Streptomyces]|uniref:Uncharacterized protein n=1 Tax=Streptomyces sp. 900129855 TaxID=3155129 RepID=A0ABV2ZFG6_9ACTN
MAAAARRVPWNDVAAARGVSRAGGRQPGRFRPVRGPRGAALRCAAAREAASHPAAPIRERAGTVLAAGGRVVVRGAA